MRGTSDSDDDEFDEVVEAAKQAFLAGIES